MLDCFPKIFLLLQLVAVVFSCIALAWRSIEHLIVSGLFKFSDIQFAFFPKLETMPVIHMYSVLFPLLPADWIDYFNVVLCQNIHFSVWGGKAGEKTGEVTFKIQNF